MALNPTDPAKAQVWVRGEAPNQVLDIYVPRGARGEVGPQGPLGPPVALAVSDTVTGPETPGATGPQGIQGLKGDPGGWVVTALGTEDLNLITTDGIYRQGNANNATALANYPQYSAMGVLYVTRANGSGYLQQEYRTVASPNDGSIYIRTYANGAWSPWKGHFPTRVSNSAGRAIYQYNETTGGEQLIYGDTGWRDLTGVLLNGWTATWCKLRRVGSTVTMVFVSLNSSVATADPAYVLPVGFRPNTGGYHQGYFFTDTTIASGFVRITGGGSMELTRRPATPYSANLQSVVQWTVDDPWPTTLPGTASGTIPNA